MVDQRILEIVEYWVKCDYPYSGYEVSNLGRVRNAKNNKILTATFTDNDYYRVHVTNDEGDEQNVRIHRLVCTTFNGESKEGQTDVNHINEIKTDDRCYNLNWMTREENNNWGTRNERARESLIEYFKNRD